MSVLTWRTFTYKMIGAVLLVLSSACATKAPTQTEKIPVSNQSKSVSTSSKEESNADIKALEKSEAIEVLSQEYLEIKFPGRGFTYGNSIIEYYKNGEVLYKTKSGETITTGTYEIKNGTLCESYSLEKTGRYCVEIAPYKNGMVRLSPTREKLSSNYYLWKFLVDESTESKNLKVPKSFAWDGGSSRIKAEQEKVAEANSRKEKQRLLERKLAAEVEASVNNKETEFDTPVASVEKPSKSARAPQVTNSSTRTSSNLTALNKEYAKLCSHIDTQIERLQDMGSTFMASAGTQPEQSCRTFSKLKGLNNEMRRLARTAGSIPNCDASSNIEFVNDMERTLKPIIDVTCNGNVSAANIASIGMPTFYTDTLKQIEANNRRIKSLKADQNRQQASNNVNTTQPIANNTNRNSSGTIQPIANNTNTNSNNSNQRSRLGKDAKHCLVDYGKKHGNKCSYDIQVSHCIMSKGTGYCYPRGKFDFWGTRIIKAGKQNLKYDYRRDGRLIIGVCKIENSGTYQVHVKPLSNGQYQCSILSH